MENPVSSNIIKYISRDKAVGVFRWLLMGSIEDDLHEIIMHQAEYVHDNRPVYEQDISISGIVILPKVYKR